jgi:hypothetical protein
MQTILIKHRSKIIKKLESYNGIEAKGIISISKRKTKLCSSFYLKKIEDKLPKDLF